MRIDSASEAGGPALVARLLGLQRRENVRVAEKPRDQAVAGDPRRRSRHSDTGARQRSASRTGTGPDGLRATKNPFDLLVHRPQRRASGSLLVGQTQIQPYAWYKFHVHAPPRADFGLLDMVRGEEHGFPGLPDPDGPGGHPRSTQAGPRVRRMRGCHRRTAERVPAPASPHAENLCPDRS